MKDNKQSSRFFDIKPRSFVKLSSSVIERIFSEFSFRTLNKKSSSNIIYKNIVNTAFGACIIVSKQVLTNIEFSVNDNICDLLPRIEKLCSEQTKKNIDIVSLKAQICCEAEEEEDYETIEDVHLRLGI
jgi:monomeric isocitrate dehydrogenase